MKLTFVSPRYGTDIVGGAEYAVRVLAENCMKYAGIEAEVLTTTAGDERTWSQQYSAGSEKINGVSVHRFSNHPIDRGGFDAWAQPLLAHPEKVTEQDFDQWLIKQGPYSPELLDAIAQCTSDAVVFHPMLSSPASHGLLVAQVPTILHPALHDEPLARMTGYSRVMNSASLLAFSTRFEQELGMKLYNTTTSRQSVIGFGIDDPIDYSTGVHNEVRETYGLDDQPYVLVLGRVDPGKGSDVVAHMWEYAQQFLPEYKLVFVGPVSDSSYVSQRTQEQLTNDNIVLTGSVSDPDRDVLLSQARALITPSVTESFSLVLLEAMSFGTPVVVNGYCGPTREHIEKSGSGSSFIDTETFVSALISAAHDSPMRDTWISRGKSYVQEQYSWEKVIQRYCEALSTISPAFSTSTS